jgi:hypothetical protein
MIYTVIFWCILSPPKSNGSRSTGVSVTNLHGTSISIPEDYDRKDCKAVDQNCKCDELMGSNKLKLLHKSAFACTQAASNKPFQQKRGFGTAGLFQLFTFCIFIIPRGLFQVASQDCIA